MTEINQNALLMEMQKLIQEAQAGSAHFAAADADNGTFVSQLNDAISKVNYYQENAQNLATRFEYGDDSVSLSEVMMALQKSNISLQAITQVRNKLVNAYQEIMNMPI